MYSAFILSHFDIQYNVNFEYQIVIYNAPYYQKAVTSTSIWLGADNKILQEIY